MPTILHIGGVNSPHVLGIVEQIKKYTNFKQVIVSYPAIPKEFDMNLINDIPQYFYKYPAFFTPKKVPKAAYADLAGFVCSVIKKEKPDIIHGHYLSKCAFIMYYFMVYSKKPGIVVPWSTWDIPNNKEMFARNKACLDSCRYVMCNNRKFLTALLSKLNQPQNKGLFSFPPIRLFLYPNRIPNTDVPRLLITRKHYQDVFFKALPSVIKMFPNIEITALSPPSSIELAKKLGIHSRIKFLDDMVSQEEFAKLIQQHNIVRSMAPDHSTSSTTIQAAYSGAVTLVHKSVWDDTFVDNVNVLKCDMTIADLQNKLIYAIKNLPELCTKFKQNNAFLKDWDAEVTWNNLHEAYCKMLAG